MTQQPATEQPAAQPYPVRLEVDYPERQSRWKALLRVFLVIPLLIFVYVLNNSIELAIIAAILVRGRIPRWLFEFQVAFNRWSLRFISYAFLLTDEYPPFEGDYPVRYEVDYPERLSRWRLVIWKLITSVPHFIVLTVLSLTLVVVVPIGWFAILIVGRFPRGLHQYVAGVLRWGARVSAYLYSLTDEFPPFSLSPQAGPGGRDSNVISAVVGSIVVALVIAGAAVGITIAAVVEFAEEEVRVDYDELVAGGPGEAVDVGSVAVELIGASDPADRQVLPQLAPRRGERFVELLITIDNESGSQELDISPDDFELKADGKTHDPVLVTVNGSVAPGELEEDSEGAASVIFEIPNRAEPVEFRYDPSRFGPETIVFEFR